VRPRSAHSALGYRDAAGAFVRRPMPAKYPHQPISDADEPCPVCGAVLPTEDSRAGRGTKGTDTFLPSPLVVCRVCGHQEQAGGIVRFRAGPTARMRDQVTRTARVARIRAEQTAQRCHSNKTDGRHVPDLRGRRLVCADQRSPAPTASERGLVFKLIHIGDTLNLIDPARCRTGSRPRGWSGPRSRSVGARSAGATRNLGPTPDFGSVGAYLPPPSPKSVRQLVTSSGFRY
jgi:hypothetical protein